MHASVPSKIALATSLASARVLAEAAGDAVSFAGAQRRHDIAAAPRAAVAGARA